LRLLGKNLLIVTAHPDDESFLCAGLIHKNSVHHGRTSLICATNGEAGKHHLKKPTSAKNLAKTRREELILVSKFIGINRLNMLSLPDGRLNLNKPKFFKQSWTFAKACPVDVIISFGPDGITGHLDHIACYEVAIKLAKKIHVPLVTFTIPNKILSKASKFFKIRRISPHYHDQPLKHQKPNLQLKVNPAIKLEALRMHRSQYQTNPLYHFPKDVAKEILNYECFCYNKASHD